MRDQNIRPTAETYNSMLTLLSRFGQHEAMYAIFTDMVAAGVEPDLETYNLLLYSSRFSDLEPYVIIARMEAAGVEPNGLTYENLIHHSIQDWNLEMSLRQVDEMRARGIQPTLPTVQRVIALATTYDYARLALDLAHIYEEQSFRRLSPESWMQMLASCAELHWIEGVEQCWTKGVVEGLVSPDEGICIDVLNVAARAGRPNLATDVIATLRKIGVVFREYHLAPVLEAFMNAGNLTEAITTLSLMRQNTIAPNEHTTEPIFRHISQNVDEVDKAYYVLEELKSAGKVIDVSALNVVIRASVELGDLQRAVATYKESEKLGVVPTRDTYYYLLDACIQAKHYALGEKLFEHMTKAGIKPDPAGLERMLVLSLTQPTYEEAFYYLEELKTKMSEVPARVYEAIIRKCVVSFDPRWKIAAEEMQQLGYTLSSGLLRFIAGGDEATEEQQPSAEEFEQAPSGSEQQRPPLDGPF
ncbi:hypothetical protein CALCODRAFT_523891 [Calocera cornea HHB12733]|uniref:Pentatricopeptide repeat-containing protein-mitochondrial domain-containing protein n=1 Tax=Calocera cornea HHB12733 TaxID=1353952 RepID=A0A165G957_9BASI|nr:hypothetical protein CALCODRAFT_523891 [Calocera cornea HHB12733]